jgi:hypothetical protein
VRLDHLLSKEQLAARPRLVVQSHNAGECSAVVSSWVERWLVGTLDLLWVASTASVWKAMRRGGGAGHAVGCLRVRAFGSGPSVPAPVNSPCGGVMGGWSLFENCTVDASICGQVFKGARWMPWYQEPMKDVGGRDSPRGVVNQAVIRGFPNGETRQSSWAVTRC